MAISALNKYKLCFDPAAPDDGDNLGAYLRSSDGTLLTHSSVNGCEALDVNICNDLDIDVKLDGVYDGVSNTDPDNAGLIAHQRAAAPGDAEQTFRSTGAHPDSDDVAPADVHAVDVNSFLMAYDGTNWDRLTLTDGNLNVNIVQDPAACLRVEGCTDDDDADDDKPIKIGFKAMATLDTVDDGDRANGISDIYRRQYVNTGANVAIANAAVAVDDTAGGTQLSASPIASRRNMIIQNRGNKSVYLGGAGVTIANGIELPACAIAQLDIGPNIDIRAIKDTPGGDSDVRIMELG